MSDTAKTADFLSESMKGKDVASVPGIGEDGEKKLLANNITSAQQVYGKFLFFNNDPNRFADWFSDQVGTGKTNSTKCFKALQRYFNSFF